MRCGSFSSVHAVGAEPDNRCSTSALSAGACDEGHLFCVDCIGGHAKNQIGSQIVEVRRLAAGSPYFALRRPADTEPVPFWQINCMDTSGCQASFHESELRRVLPAQLIGLCVLPPQFPDGAAPAARLTLSTPPQVGTPAAAEADRRRRARQPRRLPVLRLCRRD